MFHFLPKKESSIAVIDTIWISEEAKWQACLKKIAEENNTIIVAWFDATYNKLESLFLNNNLPADKIFITRGLARNHIENASVVFAEHYPLVLKEEELYKKLGLSQVNIYSSLDEPLFARFGGDKIIGLVKQLGMKSDEAIEHPFITSSIKNAQEKISKSVRMEQSASSQADWFVYNLG
jgi:preprotein translocase subunit SecA